MSEPEEGSPAVPTESEKPAGEESTMTLWGGEPFSARSSPARCAPFSTLTWKDWKQTQAQVELCLLRFVDAVEQKQAHRVVSIGMEMIEIAGKMFLEAYALGVNEQVDLQPIPPEQLL
jgi:hypothetical protein